MRARTTAAVTAVILAGFGIGAALAPAKAESREPRPEPSQSVQVFTGGSSYIGVSVRDVDAGDVKAQGGAPAGVLVEGVSADSPAEAAGFREGDVVLEFDGERVRSVRQFTRLVQETPAGREVQAVVMRDGQRTTLAVAPTASGRHSGLSIFRGDEHRWIIPHPPEPPEPPTPAPAPLPPLAVFPRFEGLFGSSGRLGVTVDTLSDQLAEYFGADEGVLVTSVRSGSAAEKAGLRAGDVIVSMNGNPVDSSSDLSRRTQRLEDGDEFTLEIVRDKQKQTLKGKVEPRQPRRWTVRTAL